MHKVHILPTHHITVLVKLEATLDHAFKLKNAKGMSSSVRAVCFLEDVDRAIQIYL